MAVEKHRVRVEALLADGKVLDDLLIDEDDNSAHHCARVVIRRGLYNDTNDADNEGQRNLWVTQSTTASPTPKRSSTSQ